MYTYTADFLIGHRQTFHVIRLVLTMVSQWDYKLQWRHKRWLAAEFFTVSYMASCMELRTTQCVAW